VLVGSFRQRKGLDARSLHYHHPVVAGERITGAAEMPIRRYVEKGVVFTPQRLSAMSKALVATTEILGIERDEARQAVARFIIRLARKDDSLDAAELRDKAVAA
jgi:hypothetical protein